MTVPFAAIRSLGLCAATYARPEIAKSGQRARQFLTGAGDCVGTIDSALEGLGYGQARRVCSRPAACQRSSVEILGKAARSLAALACSRYREARGLER